MDSLKVLGIAGLSEEQRTALALRELRRLNPDASLSEGKRIKGGVQIARDFGVNYPTLRYRFISSRSRQTEEQTSHFSGFKKNTAKANDRDKGNENTVHKSNQRQEVRSFSLSDSEQKKRKKALKRSRKETTKRETRERKRLRKEEKRREKKKKKQQQQQQEEEEVSHETLSTHEKKYLEKALVQYVQERIYLGMPLPDIKILERAKEIGIDEADLAWVRNLKHHRSKINLTTLQMYACWGYRASRIMNELSEKSEVCCVSEFLFPVGPHQPHGVMFEKKDNTEYVTMIVATSSIGRQLPPFFVLPSGSRPDGWKETCKGLRKQGAFVAESPRGLASNEVIVEWTKLFVNSCNAQVLIVDWRDSHFLNDQAAQILVQHGVQPIVTPPFYLLSVQPHLGCTHPIQVGLANDFLASFFFKSNVSLYGTAVDAWSLAYWVLANWASVTVELKKTSSSEFQLALAELAKWVQLRPDAPPLDFAQDLAQQKKEYR